MKTKELPPDVLTEDCEYRRGITDPDDKAEWEAHWVFRKKLSDESLPDVLTFYLVPGCGGWVLTTLHISKAGKRSPGTPDRTYGIGLKDGKVYTVGRGPHVTQVVEVYLRRDNYERLTKYVELWKKGMADAGGIRDRISSRRAQGQQHRAAGRTHWRW